MRVCYAIYAALVIALLWTNLGGSLVRNLVLWAWIALWVVGVVLVSFKAERFRWLALVPFAPLIVLLLVHSGQSVAFILEHRGLDCATCDGSPMAFVLFWGIETALLVSGAALCIHLVRGMQRGPAS